MNEKKKRSAEIIKCLFLGGLLLFFLIGFDQYSKQLAEAYLMGKKDIILIPGIFRLTYVENFGAAFGILKNSRILLLLGPGILLVYVLLLYIKLLIRQRYRFLRILCLLIAAGGAGNIIDRIWRGYVVDFFYFELIHFPVFNMADCYITCSVGLLVISCFTVYKNDNLDILALWKT